MGCYGRWLCSCSCSSKCTTPCCKSCLNHPACQPNALCLWLLCRWKSDGWSFQRPRPASATSARLIHHSRSSAPVSTAANGKPRHHLCAETLLRLQGYQGHPPSIRDQGSFLTVRQLHRGIRLSGKQLWICQVWFREVCAASYKRIGR